MSYRIQACNSFPFFSAVLCPGNKLITFILFVFTTAFAQEGKPTVAILDFEGQGIPVASGVYFAVLRDSRQVRITKMMLLK